MCLAVPGKILEIDGNKAIIEYGQGVTNKANISLVDVKVGDYVLVHAGFAIKTLDEKEALETLEVWRQVLEAAGDETFPGGGPPDA
jgi:hydrogenase expression/formation protein HypC